MGGLWSTLVELLQLGIFTLTSFYGGHLGPAIVARGAANRPFLWMESLARPDLRTRHFHSPPPPGDEHPEDTACRMASSRHMLPGGI